MERHVTLASLQPAESLEAVWDLVSRGFAVVVLPVPVEDVIPRPLFVGTMMIDVEAHRVTIDEEELPMSSTQLRLLAELARSEGRVRTFDELVELVWGYPSLGDYAALRTTVCRVRKLLRSRGCPVEIANVRGVGFTFRVASDTPTATTTAAFAG